MHKKSGSRAGIALPRISAFRRFASLTICGLFAVVTSSQLLISNVFAQEISDLGDFEIVLESADSHDSDVRRVAHKLATGEGLVELVRVERDLNEEFNLAEHVRIVFATWAHIGELADGNLGNRDPGALFDRAGTNDIFISYEFMAKILDTFDGEQDAWITNVINVVLHEVGHAMIYINRIDSPGGGKNPEIDERDADAVAFFVMSEFYDKEGELDQVAELFWRFADAASLDGYDHFSELDRADRYQCWAEGSSGSGSPECTEQYTRLMDTWDELLAPSWKDQFGAY